MLACLQAMAQHSFTVDAPRVVSTDETFRVVFTADGKMSDFNWPGTDDFTIVWGPQQGSMSSTSIVNGKRTSSYQVTQSYILQAVKDGTFTLPAATCTIDKTEYSSGGFTIEVVKGETAQQPAASGSSTQNDNRQAESAAQSSTSADQDVFIQLTVGKRDLVKGEPVAATLKLFTRADIAGFEDVNFPSFNGFWSKETYTPQNLEFNRENVGGKIYNTAVIRRYMLIPQQTGDVTIDPASMVCQIRVISNNSPRSLFDGFFDSYQTVRKRISTPAIKMHVRSLPAGAPESFGGGVGEYRITAALSREDLRSHEAASLVVTVTGSGNISLIEAPKVNFPPDFEVYDMKVTDKLSADGTSGTRTFEYPFIPRSHGDFTIEPVAYTYYNLKQGRYVTVSTDPISLTIERGNDIDGSGVAVPGVARQGVRNLGEDIRFIHTGNGDLKRKGSFFAFSPLFFGLLVFIILIYIVLSLVIRSCQARRRDVAGTRNRRAVKMARARLSQAREYLRQELRGAYYEELHKALLGYLSDKLTIPSAELSKERIAEALSSRGVSAEASEAALRILDTCEFARYAPDAEVSEMEKLYEDAVSAISDIDAQIRTSMKSKPSRGAAVAIMLMLGLALPYAAAAAEVPSEDWTRGSEAFLASDYDAALVAWQAVEADGWHSSDLYYNIGNCYYKKGEIARAILYYERALKLDPANRDAAFNLEVARQSTLDRIDAVPDFFLVTWTRNVRHLLSPDSWAIVALVLALIAVLLLLVFRFGRSLGLRRFAFIMACIAAGLFLLSVLCAASGKSEAMNEDSAIVVQPVSTVRSSPGDGGKAVFILHEGTRVRLLDELGSWWKVEIADGRQGWIESSDAEII